MNHRPSMLWRVTCGATVGALAGAVACSLVAIVAWLIGQLGGGLVGYRLVGQSLLIGAVSGAALGPFSALPSLDARRLALLDALLLSLAFLAAAAFLLIDPQSEIDRLARIPWGSLLFGVAFTSVSGLVMGWLTWHAVNLAKQQLLTR